MTPSARPKVLALDNLKRFRSMDEECAKSEFAIIDDSRIEFIQPPEREGEYDVETWVREAIKDVSAVITNRWGYALSPEALDAGALRFRTEGRADFTVQAAKKLKLIVVPSAGYDQINTSDIKRRGIRLANTPNGLVEATAETAFILALWTMRDMKALERIVSKGSVRLSSRAMWLC